MSHICRHERLTQVVLGYFFVVVDKYVDDVLTQVVTEDSISNASLLEVVRTYYILSSTIDKRYGQQVLKVGRSRDRYRVCLRNPCLSTRRLPNSLRFCDGDWLGLGLSRRVIRSFARA